MDRSDIAFFRINQLTNGRHLASSDDSVALQYHPPPQDAASSKAPRPLKHPSAAKALLPLSLPALTLPEDLADAIDAYLITAYGDTIRVYDVSAPHEPKLLREVADGHWHDVVGLALWVRSVHVELPDQKTRTRVEPWIVSASLDGTIQRWKFAGEFFAIRTRVGLINNCT